MPDKLTKKPKSGKAKAPKNQPSLSVSETLEISFPLRLAFEAQIPTRMGFEKLPLLFADDFPAVTEHGLCVMCRESECHYYKQIVLPDNSQDSVVLTFCSPRCANRFSWDSKFTGYIRSVICDALRQKYGTAKTDNSGLVRVPSLDSQAMRAKILKLFQDGDFCRYVDHVQQTCECESIIQEIQSIFDEADSLQDMKAALQTGK